MYKPIAYCKDCDWCVINYYGNANKGMCQRPEQVGKIDNINLETCDHNTKLVDNDDE